MPSLDYRQLESEPELRLAHVVLCAITQSYVWMAGKEHIPQVRIGLNRSKTSKPVLTVNGLQF